MVKPFANSPRFRAPRNALLRSTSLTKASLRDVAFFSGRDPRFVEEVTQDLHVELFAEGEVIMTEGEIGDKMYFLHRGAVDVFVGPTQEKVASLKGGSIFGEMALFGSLKRIATVKATELCDCRVILHRAFHLILKHFPKERAYFQELTKKTVARSWTREVKIRNTVGMAQKAERS